MALMSFGMSWESMVSSETRRMQMTQVSARLPDELVKGIDATARRLKRSRADVIRQALESDLDDVEDLRLAVERLQDPSDPVLDWDEVRTRLLDAD